MAGLYEQIEAGEFDAAIRPLKRGDLYAMRRRAQARSEAEFRAALCKGYGVPSEHPLAKQLFSLAWELYHGAGLKAVANGFGELMYLWDTAADHGMRTEVPDLTTPASTT